MSTKILQLQIPQGETWSQNFQTDFDFSGGSYSARMKVRRSDLPVPDDGSDNTVAFSLTSDDGISFLDNGVVNVTIPASSSDYIVFNGGRIIIDMMYDLEIVNGITDVVTRTHEGRVQLRKNVTSNANSLVPSPTSINFDDANPTTKGLIVKSGIRAFTTREIQPDPSNAGIVISGGDGVSSNPLVGIDIEALSSTPAASLDDILIIKDLATGTNHKVSVAALTAIEKSARVVADNAIIATQAAFETASNTRLDNIDALIITNETDRDSQISVDKAAQDAINNTLASDITSNATTAANALSAHETAQDTQRTNDIANQTAINATLGGEIDSEEASRIAADNALSNTISTNETNRDASVAAQFAASDSDEQQYRTDHSNDTANALATHDAERDAYRAARVTERNADVADRVAGDNTQAAALSSYETANDARSTNIETSVSDEITDRANADTQINNTITANESNRDTQRTNDITQFNSDFVRKTGNHNESITGMKTFQDVTTFSNDVIFTGNTVTVNSTETEIADRIITLNSDEDGIPSQNAGIEVHRGPNDARATVLFDEANDVFVAGLVGNLDTIVLQGNLTSEVNTLNSTITTNESNRDTQRTTDLSSIQNDLAGKANSSHTHDASQISGVLNTARIPDLPTGQITSGTFLNARISQGSVTQHESQLSITGNQITSGQVSASRIAPLNANQISGGEFADARISFSSVTQHLGNYVALTGNQSIDGQKSFIDVTKFASTPQLDGLDARLSDHILTSAPLRYNAGAVTNATNNSDLMPKSYIDLGDSLNIKKTGGTMDGSLVMDDAAINLNDGIIRFRDASGTVGEGDMYSNSSSFFLRHINANGVGAQISLSENLVTVTKELRVNTQGSNSASVVTIAHADANFVDNSTNQTIGGAKSFTGSMKIENVGGGAISLSLANAGNLSGQIIGYGTRFDILRKKSDGSTGSNIRLSDSGITLSHRTTCSEATVSGDSANVVTTKGYVDDNANSVQQQGSVEVKLPTGAAGAIGDALRIASISGGVVQLEWFTP